MYDVHVVTNHMYGIFVLALVYKPYVIRQCMIDTGVVRYGWSLDSCILFLGVGGCITWFIQYMHILMLCLMVYLFG